MPPRGAPTPGRGGTPRGAGPASRGAGGPPRGGPAGRGAGGPPRGGPAGRGAGGPPIRSGGPAQQGPSAGVPVGGAAHITTVGVRRPAYGKLGRELNVTTNTFPCQIPTAIIFHYDVILPADKVLPARLNLEIITRLQTVSEPDVFATKAVYDGRKNLFASKELVFGPNREIQREFLVTLEDPPAPESEAAKSGKAPKAYRVILKKVATINPTVLRRFLDGMQSIDSDVLTAITALNVVIRMEPNLNYPFNVRSFFTDKEVARIGAGIELWRGYFQSVRPAVGTMVINIDISTGAMYKPGPLLEVCLEWLTHILGHQARDKDLVPGPHGLTERHRVQLQRYLAGVRVETHHRPGTGPGGRQMPRLLKRLADGNARTAKFQLKEGGFQTVEQYFIQTYNKRLRFPDVVCVEVGAGAVLPMEVCTVLPGQILKKQVPPDKTRDVLAFATQKPADRLSSIIRGLDVLAYGTSQYVRSFGMTVSTQPITLKARILPPPGLLYGKAAQMQPRDGAWNMKDRLFYRPAVAPTGWWLWNFDPRTRMEKIIEGLAASARETGVQGIGPAPTTYNGDPLNRDPNMSFEDYLEDLWTGAFSRAKQWPNLIVIILPTGSSDMYTNIKYFGDVKHTVPTQCLAGLKAAKGNAQYFANVMLKVNVKLGGINVIPDARSVPYLMSEREPTLVLGADVIHPTPGGENRPSFAALVSNCDTHVAKYIASMGPQESRTEIIADLERFTMNALRAFRQYRGAIEKATNAPRRIIYFRDGVSEGQFQQILDSEIPAIKEACIKSDVRPMPALTALIVGKRHHVRMFPPQGSGDRSGNCPAGTVIDTGIVHPTEFDFFLQSHAGLLGTSKASHYSVLVDESNMQPDQIQQLCYSLCHVYARSTRAVSIPAPVYYADIVCARYKHHFKPGTIIADAINDMESRQGVAGEALEKWRRAFREVTGPTAKNMYFM